MCRLLEVSIDRVGRRIHRLTPQWSGPLARIRSPRPLTVGVDMTADVKPHARVRCSTSPYFDVSLEVVHHRPSEETGPVTTTVDHADIRGLVTTLLVSVGVPASV